MRRMFEMLQERDDTIRRKDTVIRRLQTEIKKGKQ